MSSAAWDDICPIPREIRWSALAACALFVAFVGARLIIQYTHSGHLYLEDDAYYYTVIAYNIAHTGVSTFDGQTLTNGYHPLWLAVLVLQDLVLGSSLYVTILIELVFATAGLFFFLVSFRTKSAPFRIAFALAYALLAWPMIAKGMEVSLLLFTLGVFMRIAVECLEGRDRYLALGFASAACIGARLDVAAFVVPMALLVAGSPRRSLPVIAPPLLAGALYAGANFWLFGLPLPVSGAIKSLGGMQLNWALFDQVASYWHASGALKSSLSFLNSYIGRSLILFALVALALLMARRGRKSLPLCLGYALGFILFAMKLALFSSWVVWPWYAFATIIGLAAAFHVIDDYIVASRRGGSASLQIAIAALLLLCAGWVLRSTMSRPDQNFEDINIEAVAKFGPILNGVRVAMGDRAGSFAAHYPGPVTQIEGLVNDWIYLEAIQRHADIRPLLCARGVRYVLAYQRDLGAYDVATVSALRPSLTSFSGSTLKFSHLDEIGRVFDLAKYDNSVDDTGDNYLYAWHLSGCTEAGRAAARH